MSRYMNVEVGRQTRLILVLLVMWNLAVGLLFVIASPFSEFHWKVFIIDKYDYSDELDRAVVAALAEVGYDPSLYLVENNTYEHEAFDEEYQVGIKWREYSRRLDVPRDSTLVTPKQLKVLESVIEPYGATVTEIKENYVADARIISLEVVSKQSVRETEFNLVHDSITITQYGVLPPKSITEQTGKVAIIVDDIGYRVEGVEAFLAIDRPLSFAVLPNTPYMQSEAAKIDEAGHTVLLHMPMEALDSQIDPGPGSIRVDMTRQEILETVFTDLSKVPYVKGVSNHMGSRVTANPDVMNVVLTTLLEEELFFVDSKTTSHSVVEEIASEVGIGFASNDFFLDNKSDVEYIRERIRTMAKKALRDGYAIGILHDRMGSSQAIASMIPELESAGIELVYVEELISFGTTE